SLIKTVIESKQAIVSKKNVTVVNQVPDDILVKGDRFLLHQALSNLVQNAIDFSPPGSQIKLIGRVEISKFYITVEDSGSGIPDYATAKIFDKFFSLRRPDNGKKSTGLGLNFVKEVAILHNGEIKLENRTQRGVQATLMIPT
ncbi:MAG: ATP-binding protein, partial [Desulfobacterales bacterium]